MNATFSSLHASNIAEWNIIFHCAQQKVVNLIMIVLEESHACLSSSFRDNDVADFINNGIVPPALSECEPTPSNVMQSLSKPKSMTVSVTPATMLSHVTSCNHCILIIAEKTLIHASILKYIMHHISQY